MNVKYPDVTVDLSGGVDGNAFAIIQKVKRAIRREHGDDAAEEYAKEARLSTSYDALIQHTMATVNVE